MSWNEAYKQLVQELCHEPSTKEIQERMLEIAMSKLEDEN